MIVIVIVIVIATDVQDVAPIAPIAIAPAVAAPVVTSTRLPPRKKTGLLAIRPARRIVPAVKTDPVVAKKNVNVNVNVNETAILDDGTVDTVIGEVTVTVTVIVTVTVTAIKTANERRNALDEIAPRLL